MSLLQPIVALAIIRIALGIYWLSNAIRDFQLGRHKEMGFFLQMMARENKIKWYGSFMTKVIVPSSAFWGYFIPISMLLMGISLVSGIWTSIALVGGTLLCLNVLFAFGFSKERPQLALLILCHLALFLSNAAGGALRVPIFK